MAILCGERVPIHERTVRRELVRRGVQLYKIGSTIIFDPAVLYDLIAEYRATH